LNPGRSMAGGDERMLLAVEVDAELVAVADVADGK
jgi:hypothetical protein